MKNKYGNLSLLKEVLPLIRDFVDRHSGDKLVMAAFTRYATHKLMKGGPIDDPETQALFDSLDVSRHSIPRDP